MVILSGVFSQLRGDQLAEAQGGSAQVGDPCRGCCHISADAICFDACPHHPPHPLGLTPTPHHLAARPCRPATPLHPHPSPMLCRDTPACLPACLPARLPPVRVFLPACLPPVPACLPACRPSTAPPPSFGCAPATCPPSSAPSSKTCLSSSSTRQAPCPLLLGNLQGPCGH